MYVDYPPLDTLPTDNNTDKYKTLLPRPYSPFRILQVTNHNLTMDENGITNAVSIDRATPVAWIINHLGRFKALETFSGNKKTLHKTYSCTETGNTSPPLRDSIYETGPLIPTLNSAKPSNKGILDSVETIYSNRKTSMEDNYGPL